jgi:hypothetical protein
VVAAKLLSDFPLAFSQRQRKKPAPLRSQRLEYSPVERDASSGVNAFNLDKVFNILS